MHEIVLCSSMLFAWMHNNKIENLQFSFIHHSVCSYVVWRFVCKNFCLTLLHKVKANKKEATHFAQHSAQNYWPECEWPQTNWVWPVVCGSVTTIFPKSQKTERGCFQAASRWFAVTSQIVAAGRHFPSIITENTTKALKSVACAVKQAFDKACPPIN